MNTHHHRHRNAHPDDQKYFSGQHLLSLQRAIYELCWLLNRGYSRHSSTNLVGDHHQLKQRQRIAIGRIASSKDTILRRKCKCLTLADITNRHLIIDGFNLIITLESAMAGALLLRCCDGSIRDLASVHGTYRQVCETKQVIELVGRALEVFEPASVQWLFDKPVSNSGRVAQLVRKIAHSHQWNWQTGVINNTDQTIISSNKIVISSDSVILDSVEEWLNMTAYLLEHQLQDFWLIDFQ